MNFPTIRIEGSILSPDILDKIEQSEITGQSPKDFGFDLKIKVKDEIARAWADANSQWKIYKSRIENLKESESGNTETRKYWIIPLLGFLGYDVEFSKSSESANGKSYAISHRAVNIDNFPIHVMGFKDSLDKKRADSGPRMSPHSLLQEYINLTEHLYAIVTNGFLLRLLRDSSRLIKLSYVEFDLEKMFEEEHYADFALFYRLLHSSHMPKTKDLGPESIIEKYHQDALDSGARIRDGLCNAVKSSILILGNGFLNNDSNTYLRDAIENGSLTPDEYHKSILRLIYRMLFLMVIEERGLVFPDEVDIKKKMIYYGYYSVSCLRKLCEKRFVLDEKYNNYWIQLKNTFRIFESEQYGRPLEIKPLAGDLFSYDALGLLNDCDLDNNILMQCFRNLSFYESDITNQILKVNYSALNVEEFGSVYEGLLEFKPGIQKINSHYEYALLKGSERSSSGSHYTPDELVQPLIKHSLDYIIEDKLKEKEPDKALLSITVCDVACGSGHILLNAARRIAVELAKVRTGEDQPSPSSFRHSIKDVIRNCIYGVDKNPLAVELCKIALWLESHNPGEPLSFLDHKIKCGDSIVGLAHKEGLLNGIPTEAFNRMPDDDKDICSEFKKTNKHARTAREKKKQFPIAFKNSVDSEIHNISSNLAEICNLPETTPDEVEAKKQSYLQLNTGADWWRLKNLADIQVAQFFISKTEENTDKLITDEKYYKLLGQNQILGEFLYKATSVSQEKKFFHWFLEFPEIFEKGGFDCILGNPPFLGGLKISTYLGYHLLNWIYYLNPKGGGTCDLVAYFFLRAYRLITLNSFIALLSTNTISQGDTREGGLEELLKEDGEIIFAIKSIKWPGLASVEISELVIFKGSWNLIKYIGDKKVNYISEFLTDEVTSIKPSHLTNNKNLGFIGSYILGNGFIVDENYTKQLCSENELYKEILFPYLSGDDVNSNFNQQPSRYVINFFDWELEKAKEYEKCFNLVEKTVKPQRLLNNRKNYRDYWWQYGEKRPGLYKKIKDRDKVLVCSMVSKYLNFSFYPSNIVFMHMLCVFAFDDFIHFSILNSNIHNEWAWKYSSTFGSNTLTYSLTDCFLTYPFPFVDANHEKLLIKIGKEYLICRNKLMTNFMIGLTKVYNIFHSFDPEVSEVIKNDIKQLRNLQIELDNIVLNLYNYSDINLRHDFYEVDYLPENDRVRFTIHPDARKEILKRLLELNQKIHDEEVKAGLWDKKKNKKTKSDESTDAVRESAAGLFD